MLTADHRLLDLRPKKEDMNGLACYVIDAAGVYGNFTVWFSPERDFNVVKSIFDERPGQVYENSPLPAGTHCRYEYVVDRFIKVDGLWVPAEATSHLLAELLSNEGYNYTQHHKRTNIKLLAPGEDDKSYVLYADDIPNGARLFDMRYKGAGAPEWRWQDDRFVLTPAKGGTPVPQDASGARGFGSAIVAGARR